MFVCVFRRLCVLYLTLCTLFMHNVDDDCLFAETETQGTQDLM